MRSKSLPTDQLACSKGISSSFMVMATGRTKGESSIPISIIGRLPGSSARFDDDFGGHRVRDVTGLVCAMVQISELFRGGGIVGPGDPWPETNAQHRYGAGRVLAGLTYRVVFVAIHHQTSFGGIEQEEQHVAGRQRGHERLLRIDCIWPGKRHGNHTWRTRGRNHAAAIKAPLVRS